MNEDYKNSNLKGKKLMFRKKCKKYDIDLKNRLIKTILIIDLITNTKKLKEMIIIPNKYINQILNYYHKKMVIKII